MQRLRWCGRIGASLLTALMLGSCGGFFPGSDEVTALSLSPTSAWITPTTTQQFTATATFGNNTQGDVTDQVTWLSSNTSVATIDSSGLATGVALGTATITAKSYNSSVTATAAMTVSNKTIQSITVTCTPSTISLSAGQTAGCSAQATFSDGTIGTVSATWTSSNTSVATINASGTAFPVSTGTTYITASAGGVVSSQFQLTVTT